MYEGNYLAQRLRVASLGRDDSRFLLNHQTGETVSYGAFFANAERMAAVLVAHGVKPGDRIATGPGRDGKAGQPSSIPCKY